MTTTLQTQTEQLLVDLVAEVSEMRRDTIAPEADFQEFGLDSRFVIAMNSKLEQYFPRLPRTIFFEYPSIRAVASYLVEEYAAELRALFPQGDATPAAPRPAPPPERPAPAAPVQAAPVAPPAAPVATGGLSQLSSLIQAIPVPDAVLRQLDGVPPAPVAPRAASAGKARRADSDTEEIAIIGVAGRFPKARNIEEFWRNLRDGRDCIEPLPRERWSNDPSAPLVWGGYLEGVAEFDSLFFGMAPRVAETMDPQERLFLEVAWETFESAGYDPLALARGSEPAPIGVFVGVMYGEYQVLGAELTLAGKSTLVSSSFASIPNRVSHFLNFSGPSMALDTMCSSSLTALHLACASLRSGECDVALVGGTNVTVHPNKYRLLEAGKYLASDGRCRSYGADGDGYVPAEAVGALLLKPLSAARRDGDHVWAVVKGTAINHGGRARGYTTPNPTAQAASLARALERAGVEPQTLGYIEGHGTGTSLGDPIEIRGIQKALGPVPEKIPIGSVKSNIGHAESAAGIAGLTKVLLQLRSRELVPSIHCEPPNPNIDFDRAPIYVQKEAAPWKRRTVVTDGVAREVPRRALISAFGAGGSNAQVVIEEAQEVSSPRGITAQPRLFVLSARSGERLREHAQRFLDSLSRRLPQREPEATEAFYDLCATLFHGRTKFDSRLAIVAENVRTLQQRLAAYLHGARRDANIAVNDGEPTTGQAAGLADVARRWVAGEALTGGELFAQPWKRVPLPTYPFERKRLWPCETLYDIPRLAPGAPAPVPASVPVTVPVAAPRTEEVAPAPVKKEASREERALLVREVLRDTVANLLGIDRAEINPDSPLFDYGLESVAAIELAERINAALGLDITPTVFFEFNTLTNFARHLVDRYDVSSERIAALGTSLVPPVAAKAAPASKPAPQPASKPAAPKPAAPKAAKPAAPPPSSAGPSIEDLWAEALRSEQTAPAPSPAAPAGAGVKLHVLSGVEGRAVEYATMGEGAPIFVAGGLLATHEALTLSEDIQSLAQRYRTIMVHPPGAGRSELPQGTLTMDFIVGQMEHVRQSLGLTSIALVGYSFGGLVAQAYAARFPERVSKLVLACTTSDPASVTQGMELVAAEAQRHPDGPRALQYADLRKFPLYAELSSRLTSESLSYADLPTLIVAGTLDEYVPARHAQALAARKPRATIRLVEGAGHFLALSHGDVLVAHIREFLSGEGRAPTHTPLVPMSPEALGALQAYLGEGEISSGADVSPVVGQVGYLVDAVLGGGFNSFFLPSGLEAVDAALRYGRRRAKLLKRPAEARSVILDPHGTLRRHFEFLPGERLFPDLVFVEDVRALLERVRTEADLASAYATADCGVAVLETFTSECRSRGIVSILAERAEGPDTLVTPRLQSKPDLVVLDEALSGQMLPFGVCAVHNLRELGVWTRQPEEFSVRIPGSMAGPTLAVVREHLVRRFQAVLPADAASVLRAIHSDQKVAKEAHRNYVNPAFVDALEVFGLALRQRHADPRGYEIERDDGSRARVTNLYLVTSASVRGHTGTEIANSVVAPHEPTRDYASELEARIASETEFTRTFPTSSPGTAVESALKLGLLAAKRGSSLLVLKGSALFTRLGALVSHAEPGSQLESLLETCPWSKVHAVDPFAEDAPARIEALLTGGEVGLVWLESLQSDFGGLRSVPSTVLEVIDRHRERQGYLVGVDETFTSLGCGRLFHWEGRMLRPDLTAVCVGWTDCQLLSGYVLTTREVARRAAARDAAVVSSLAEQFRSQLGAHLTLTLLDVVKREGLLARISETGQRFQASLKALAAETPLIQRVWGEGLFWAIEFNLEDWPRFVRDWFSSFVWSACLRDPVAPVALSMQPFTAACVRVEPRADMPPEEMDAALATLRRVLSKGVEGIGESVAEDLDWRGDGRRAELFRKVLSGFKAA